MKKSLKFTKMQGIGNDFIVLDGIRETIMLTKDIIRFLSDRHFGIGCDQILLVEKSTHQQADFLYRIFNADGQEVEQCGNGARCFVRFVHEQKLTQKTQLTLQTQQRLIHTRLEKNGQITVDMGTPIFTPAAIPFIADKEAITYPLSIASEIVHIGAISMGNPHAVLFVNNIEEAPVASLGALIQNHERFPDKANVGFVEIITSSHIKLRVFERGAGETLACGTGACAAVVAGIQQHSLSQTVHVDTKGGRLTIHWQKDHHPVLMSGPAMTVFHGEIIL